MTKKEYMRAYCLRNLEKKKEYNRSYYLANRIACLEGASKYRKVHREKYRAYSKAYRVANLEKVRREMRTYYVANRPEMLAYLKIYRSEHKEEKRARRRTDSNYRLLENLRSRIYHAVKDGCGVKSARTLELVGCTIPEFRARLEAKFRPGMTWENYGPVWHIDHIRPCCTFDLSDPGQQRECFHWSNTQPLFAEENLRKRKK